MKNLSLILSAVLFVAVGVLFYLNLAGKKSAPASGTSAIAGDIQVAYIRTDSVVKNYEYIKVTREILVAKGQKLEKDFQNRAQALKNDIDGYQRNVGNLTISQAKALEEDLGKKQQNLQMFQQQLQQEMGNDESKLTEELYKRLTTFLAKYSAEKGIQMVVKFDTSSDVLYASEGLDVTNDVLTGLNAEYKTEKTGVPAAKDSSTVKH